MATLVAISIIAVIGQPRVAVAAPPTAVTTSGTPKQRGDEAFDARRYDEAAALYEEAYAALEDPALLYNLARTYQALGRYSYALQRIEAFSKLASADLRNRIPKLDALVADLRAHVATLTITCNVAGARILVRDAVVGESATKKTFLVNAGVAKIEVAKDGYAPYVASTELAGGETTMLNVTLQRLAEEPRREPLASASESSSIFSRWWFWTGVGVVVIGVGAYLVVTSQQEKDAPRGTIPPGQVSAPLLRF